jgi:hypothetical protein
MKLTAVIEIKASLINPTKTCSKTGEGNPFGGGKRRGYGSILKNNVLSPG